MQQGLPRPPRSFQAPGRSRSWSPIPTAAPCKRPHLARPGSAPPGCADLQLRFQDARASQSQTRTSCRADNLCAISPARPRPTQFHLQRDGWFACGRTSPTFSLPKAAQDRLNSPPSASAPAQPSLADQRLLLSKVPGPRTFCMTRDCLGGGGEIRLQPDDRLSGLKKIAGPTTCERNPFS
jgi:hypothetical protein